ncbi:MAG: tRNA pseudouridine(38-40) synthase TruA [bacterium]
MRNIALRLTYDGTNFHGWQFQNDLRTVAGTLEAAWTALTGEEKRVTGCGRTDAGVHALRYCANFRTETRIPTEKLPFALNFHLPDDVAVMSACEVEPEFNAILSCVKKEYTYRLVSSRIRDPFLKHRAYTYPLPLDLEKMRRAAAAFEGTHDFAAVRSVGTETRTTVRTVHWCVIEEGEGGLVQMRICADGFLYNMVRAIMGTVLYCSEGKLEPEDIPRLLETRNRRLTGPTVPPQGLYLTRIWYHGPAGEMMQAP